MRRDGVCRWLKRQLSRRPPAVVLTIHEVADDAMVMRDALLSSDPDAAIIERIQWLMGHSLRMHRQRYPRRHPHRNAMRRWWASIGYRVEYGQGEHSYICVFCRDNVVTLSNKGRSLPATISDRLRLHGWSCGMLYLMELGGHHV